MFAAPENECKCSAFACVFIVPRTLPFSLWAPVSLYFPSVGEGYLAMMAERVCWPLIPSTFILMEKLFILPYFGRQFRCGWDSRLTIFLLQDFKEVSPLSSGRCASWWPICARACPWLLALFPPRTRGGLSLCSLGDWITLHFGRFFLFVCVALTEILSSASEQCFLKSSFEYF